MVFSVHNFFLLIMLYFKILLNIYDLIDNGSSEISAGNVVYCAGDLATLYKKPAVNAPEMYINHRH